MSSYRSVGINTTESTIVDFSAATILAAGCAEKAAQFPGAQPRAFLKRQCSSYAQSAGLPAWEATITSRPRPSDTPPTRDTQDLEARRRTEQRLRQQKRKKKR